MDGIEIKQLLNPIKAHVTATYEVAESYENSYQARRCQLYSATAEFVF